MADEPRGRLLEWSPALARADGLQGAAVGDRVEIVGAGPAFVTALATDHVELAPLSSIAPPPGSAVYGAGPLEVPVGDDLAGRSIDALGRPFDGSRPKGPPHRIFFPAPGLQEDLPRRRLTTGLWVFDFKQTIPLGATVLALGDAPRISHHLLRHNAQEGRVCIYALLSSGSSTTLASKAMFESPPPFITVEAGPDATPAAVWLIPWTAMAMAAGFREQGLEAVVVLDSLDRWRARVNSFPRQGTWPTQLGRLLGQACATRQGSASLVALGPSRYGPALESMFDSLLDLQRALRGAPLPDRSKLVRPPFKVGPANRIGAVLAILSELEDWEARQPWAGPPDPLREGFRHREALRFRPGLTTDLVEQLAAFLAVCEQAELPAAAVPPFMDSFLARLRKDHSSTLAAIRRRREYREEDHRVLMAAARRTP